MKSLMGSESGQILKRLINKVLKDRFINQPYSLYQKESVEKRDKDGIEIADSRGEEWLTELLNISILENVFE